MRTVQVIELAILGMIFLSIFAYIIWWSINIDAILKGSYQLNCMGVKWKSTSKVLF